MRTLSSLLIATSKLFVAISIFCILLLLIVKKQKPVTKELLEKPDRKASTREKEHQKEVPAMLPGADKTREKQKKIKIASLVVSILIVAFIGNYAISMMTSRGDLEYKSSE